MKENRKREEIGKREKEEIAKVRTQGPLKVEAIRWKGGEFKKSGRKRSGRRGRKKKKKKKAKYRKRKWWKKCKELIISLSMIRMKKGKKEKESKRSERRPKARQTLGKFGKWLFLFLIMGQNWLIVNAAAEGPHRRTEAVMRMQQEVQIKENRWTEATPKRWKQPKGEDRTEMKKEAKKIEVHPAQWVGLEYKEKEKARDKGKCDIFFGIEHRLWKEDMEEQFNKEAREGWRCAADAARITDENAGTEDRKHTSGGVFVAVDSNLWAVVGAEEGAIDSIPGNEGRIAQA